MSYETDINDAVLSSPLLSDLIDDRFSWEFADGETVAPFIVAQTISTDGETTHDGAREISFPLIQFSCWGRTKIEAISMRDALKRDLEGITLPGSSETTLIFQASNSTRDQDTKLYGEIIDYLASSYTTE